MAGQRLAIDSIGESYEVFAESVLNRIATLTRIGTKQDFGTDTYCQPRVPIAARMEAVMELCLLQVKGGRSPLTYGGLNARNQWKGHEVDWLRGLWAPLYLATVNPEYERVDLFSLWPIWWVMWQSVTPFKIELSWQGPVNDEFEYRAPTKRVVAEAEHGDRHVWAIDLGPPILSLSHQSLNDNEFRIRATEIFRYWIQVDRQTVARFHANVPLIDANFRWMTNRLPTARQELLAIDPRPGMNIDSLARALVPSLLGVGSHLQHQGNHEVFRLIPVLEWIETNGYGNLITGGLLAKLSRAQREGTSPATYL